MKTSRYYETPTYHSFLQLPSKKTPPSRYSSASKNPENLSQSMKLPILPNNRSSVSIVSERNTKNKLKQLSDKLQQLQADVHNTRMDGNETLNHMKYLKQELLDNQLKRDNQDMHKQVHGLKNLLAATKASHEDRSNNLRENYIQLWNQTQNLKDEVFSLRMRIDKLDEVMGMKNI